MKISAVFAIVLLLASCGHPSGVMTPVVLTATTPKTAQVDMLVATTRQPSGDPATLFNGERSPKPYLTDISVSLPPGRKSGEVQWPKRLPPNPATDFAVTHVQPIATVPEGRVWFKQHIQGGHVRSLSLGSSLRLSGTTEMPTAERLCGSLIRSKAAPRKQSRPLRCAKSPNL